MFKRILSHFFKKFISAEANQLYWKQIESSQEDKKEATLAIMKDTVNTPVILFPNQWENPVIGFVVGIHFVTKAKQPIQVVKDYITGEERLATTTAWPFTIQRFDAIMKLDPFERWVIVHPYIDREFGKGDKRLIVLTRPEIISLLNKNGFFVEFNKYLGMNDEDEEQVLTEKTKH